MLKLTAINRDEALRYMGFMGYTPDESIMSRIDALEQELIRTAVPRLVWRTEDITRENGVLSAGGVVLRGKAIEEHLDGCGQAVFMAATLSIETDRLISRAQARDMADALILDALGSAGIEQICNKSEALIKEELSGKYMTWRFSPGYGDLPLETQVALAERLDISRRAGITVTDTLLMIPRKSVTAIIGVSDSTLPKRRTGCLYCSMKDKCNFRRNGVRCTDA